MPTDVPKQTDLFFRTLVEHSSDAVALMSADGVILYANPATRKMIDYSADEFIGQNGLALIHPADINTVQSQLLTIKDRPGASVQFEYRFRNKDGSYRWVEGTATNLLNHPQVGAILGNFRDISRRKEPELQLRASEERYRMLVEQANEGIFLFDGQGRFLEGNACGYELLGWSREELMTKTGADLVVPEERARANLTLAQIKQGQSSHDIFRIARKDGSRVSVEIISTLLSNGHVQSILRDVTEHMRIEKEHALLREREQRALAQAEATQQHLYDLFMQAPAFICILRGPEHRLELMNDSFRELYGSRTFSLGKTAQENWPGLKDQGLIDLMDQVYQTGEPYIGNELPVHFIRGDRHEPELGYFNAVYQPARNAQGEVESLLIHIVEVTEQVLARQHIQQSEARFRRLVDANIVGVIFCDLQGRIKEANDVFLQMVGYTREDLEAGDIDWSKMTPEEYRALDERALQDLRHQGIIPHPYEKEYWRKDGQRLPVLITAAMLDQSNPDDCVAFVLDISERKELEQRKDDFIAMASHELKTPVTSIKGFVQVLIRRFAQRDDEETRRFLAIIDGQLNKLARLVSDLLDVSKIQTEKLVMQPERFALDDLLDEIVEQMQATTRNHTLQLQGRTQATILGDRDRIGQVLINLLANAIKYSPNRHVEPGTGTILIEAISEQGLAIVHIQDFGIGIEAIYHDKIFEQFYQVSSPTEKTYPGLGIGLYLSRQIIERHAGQLWVESSKGSGSTFSFALPIAAQQSQANGHEKEKDHEYGKHIHKKSTGC